MPKKRNPTDKPDQGDGSGQEDEQQ
ncbi:hypothetical protein PP590_gp28 [Pseudoalteromonas phage HS1]|nr:hypothetical protein PP589_gp42 [Pseudoalteromonas phage HS5]YP_010660185.1 hypothetical protein PP590_gp28 [Pseudoalteromonas phage HS1]